MSRWWQDWQHPEHARAFDFRAAMDRRNLVRAYEAFNDVRLLDERLEPSRALSLLEVGCATGELYRYLRVRYPRVIYHGIDISRPAIERARAKYPDARFFLTRADLPLAEMLAAAGAPGVFDLVYARDVVHHQTRPGEFLAEMLKVASEALVLRVRTRDVGPTETDPERSCQYHYGGWMPYIVMNLGELVERIVGLAPASEVIVYKSPVVLGGREARFLPKECYLPETGTAETAVAVILRSSRPGKILVEDRLETSPTYTLDYYARRLIARALGVLRDRVLSRPHLA